MPSTDQRKGTERPRLLCPQFEARFFLAEFPKRREYSPGVQRQVAAQAQPR